MGAVVVLTIVLVVFSALALRADVARLATLDNCPLERPCLAGTDFKARKVQTFSGRRGPSSDRLWQLGSGLNLAGPHELRMNKAPKQAGFERERHLDMTLKTILPERPESPEDGVDGLCESIRASFPISSTHAPA